MSWADISQVVSAIGTIVAVAISAYAAIQSRRSAAAAEIVVRLSNSSNVICIPLTDEIIAVWKAADHLANPFSLSVEPIYFELLNSGLGYPRGTEILFQVKKEVLPDLITGEHEDRMGGKAKISVTKTENGWSGVPIPGIECLQIFNIESYLPSWSQELAWSAFVKPSASFGKTGQSERVGLPNPIVSALVWMAIWKSPFNQDGTFEKLRKSSGSICALCVQPSWTDNEGNRINGPATHFQLELSMSKVDTSDESRDQAWLDRMSSVQAHHEVVMRSSLLRVPWTSLHQNLKLVQTNVPYLDATINLS